MEIIWSDTFHRILLYEHCKDHEIANPSTTTFLIAALARKKV
jgi:hypothetical protein